MSISLTNIDFSNISFIEPASGVSDECFEIIKRVVPINRAYDVVSAVPYHAADDEKRFENLKKAIYGKSKYIWAVKGGYGSARLFDKLKSLTPPSDEKILIGYSDVTFLHIMFNKWGWKSIHGAMIGNLCNSNLHHKNFVDIGNMMSLSKGYLKYNGIKQLNNVSVNGGIVGEIFGGNLTILANSLGTQWQIDGKEKILFIEDVNLKGYMIDRDLLHLRQSGVFKGCKAVLFGDFSAGDDFTFYAIKRFADESDIPVFYVNYFGHGEKNYPLPFGFKSSILMDSYGDFSLKIEYDFK